RVEVRNRDAGRLKPTNLSCGFGFDLFPLEAAEERALGETTQTVAKSCAIFAVRVHEGRHLRSVQNRRTINQDHVAADAQLRGASGLLHRVLKGEPISEEPLRFTSAAGVPQKAISSEGAVSSAG